METGWTLAQINIGRTVAPLDDPRLAGFLAGLDEINALAERSEGFVWRLQTDRFSGTEVPVTDDPLVIVNLTVWRTVEDLFEFTYRSAHKGVFARRFDWFERWPGPELAMWWQPAGTIPDVQDGLRRLERLATLGPSPEAFTFKQWFPPPAGG